MSDTKIAIKNVDAGIGRDFETELYFMGEKLRLLAEHPISEAYLRGTLDQFFESRKSLVQDAQYSGSILMAAIGGNAVLWAFANRFVYETNSRMPTAALFAVNLLCMLGFVYTIPLYALALAEKLEASYKLYIASSVHAMMVHKSLGLPLTHRWLWWADWENPHYQGDFVVQDRNKEPKNLIGWCIPVFLRRNWTTKRTIRFEPEFIPREGGRRPRDLLQLQSAWMYYVPNLLNTYLSMLRSLVFLSHALGVIVFALIAREVLSRGWQYVSWIWP